MLRRLAKERDLEGIDVSNIVQGGRRARRAAAVAAPINYAAIDQSDSRSDDDDDDDSGASSSQDQSSDKAGQGDASEGKLYNLASEWHHSACSCCHPTVTLQGTTCQTAQNVHNDLSMFAVAPLCRLCQSHQIIDLRCAHLCMLFRGCRKQ